MSRTYVSKALRDIVSAAAKYRCGCCLSSQWIVGSPLEIEHLIPEAMGGLTVEDNLWLACSQCNDRKSTRILVVDPLSAELVRLFDPRRDRWSDHFAWNNDGTHIVGQTPKGSATALALDLNRAELVIARKAWVSVGWHPPNDI
jgi:hypothetical protein